MNKETYEKEYNEFVNALKNAPEYGCMFIHPISAKDDFDIEFQIPRAYYDKRRNGVRIDISGVDYDVPFGFLSQSEKEDVLAEFKYTQSQTDKPNQLKVIAYNESKYQIGAFTYDYDGTELVPDVSNKVYDIARQMGAAYVVIYTSEHVHTAMTYIL